MLVQIFVRGVGLINKKKKLEKRFAGPIDEISMPSDTRPDLIMAFKNDLGT
ncbi:MAG: hypothetical protein CM15mP120_24190 [Pseudomonadota bacterium]|nr:MAG: hypothetical protein CM15mP120_24190 [Pseudomonadota bacterium]